jgi:large subunit ribosomal protein L30
MMVANEEIIGRKKLKINLKEFDSPQLYFAIRIRGAPGMSKKNEDTLKMLRMNRINHGVLIWGVKSQLGMLLKVNSYICFGEVDKKTLIRLLRTRGKVEGNKPLTDEYLRKYTDYKNIKDLANNLYEGNIKYNDKNIYKIKPIFRLHPPKGGHLGSIKKHYNEGGTLGYVGLYINQLIHKMI